MKTTVRCSYVVQIETIGVENVLQNKNNKLNASFVAFSIHSNKTLTLKWVIYSQ